MKAYVFPGQGAQFTGMGKNLYDTSPLAKDLFEQANKILGFPITNLMFAGTEEDLKQTKLRNLPFFFILSSLQKHWVIILNPKWLQGIR
jgi:[acyl-carrier-protein] S-malonyltransferase